MPARGDAVEIKINGVPTASRPTVEYYPHDLRRKGLAGRVAIAYSIDGKGRTKNIVALASDDARFERAAIKMIGDTRFKVPADWEASGNDWRRYRIQVNFLMSGMGQLPIWEDGSEAIILTTSITRVR